MRFRRAALLALSLAPVARASARQPSARVTGVVRDSIGRAPLAGALVQLVNASDPTGPARSTQTDSLGRYLLDGVPSGRYHVGFLHPLLDSLGVEPLLHEIVVSDGRTVFADLATPSAERLLAVVCGASPSDSAGMVIGYVRDPRDGHSHAGARVIGEWLEMAFTRRGFQRRTPRVEATSLASGWFALCGVPPGGAMTLTARRGDVATARIEVLVPAHGVLRRDVYVADSAIAQGVRRSGEGRIAGVVLASATGRPIANAQVALANGPEARADERGEWTLADAPLGTATLEARAVGYAPARRVVDVVPDAPRVTLRLETLKAVLDTIRVTEQAVTRNMMQFDVRRRANGGGRFLTAAQIARMRPFNTSDLLKNLAGVVVARDTVDGTIRRILMRGPFGACDPAIVVDGTYFDTLNADELDDWVHPDAIAGIEWYSEAVVPPQFRKVNTPDSAPCGSLVIWKKR